MKHTNVSDGLYYLLVLIDVFGIFLSITTILMGVEEKMLWSMLGGIVFGSLCTTSLVNKIVETLRK